MLLMLLVLLLMELLTMLMFCVLLVVLALPACFVLKVWQRFLVLLALIVRVLLWFVELIALLVVSDAEAHIP